MVFPYLVMCLHCTHDGLGVTGSADDIISVFMIDEMVSVYGVLLSCI